MILPYSRTRQDCRAETSHRALSRIVLRLTLTTIVLRNNRRPRVGVAERVRHRRLIITHALFSRAFFLAGGIRTDVL